MSEPFVHLHNHGMASLLDGFSTPEEMADRASSLEQPAIALTDHGTMAGALKFQEACDEKGIKPLIGIEGYFCEDIDRREKDDQIYHIGLIARTQEGLKKLFKLSDIGWNRGFYKKPRLDFKVFEEVCPGKDNDIIVLSGCLDGLLSHHIRRDEVDIARDNNDKLASKFNNYFIEIQPWNPPELNHALLDIAGVGGLPVVATADSHYSYPEDKEAEEVNLMIQQYGVMKDSEKNRVSTTFMESRRKNSVMDKLDFLYPNRRLRFDKIDNHIMALGDLEDKMEEQGIKGPDIYTNTVDIASMCDARLEIGQNYFPAFNKRIKSDKYLRELATDRLEELALSKDSRYVERLEEELEVITRLGFEDYMLVIWDIVNYAHNQDIMTTPGRGSVGGSLLAYVLGITSIDPIKHGLLFFRFLNLELEYDPKFTVIK